MHANDDEAYAIMEAPVQAAIDRIALLRFSTKRFIEEIRADDEGETAYQQALASMASGGEHMATMVLHGQVVPGLLRRSSRVQFGGFIHGNPSEDDGFGVPRMWVKRV
jgi:hypothetical protein